MNFSWKHISKLIEYNDFMDWAELLVSPFMVLIVYPGLVFAFCLYIIHSESGRQRKRKQKNKSE